jgi:cellulose synthase/poly-beta-1,6-N-acetylglucosamine synthase-like glycosyltransferase
MPVRDAGELLGPALDSLLAQTYCDFEVVAVDDGSADESLAALEAAAARDPRIRVESTAPRGIVPALARAAELASGELLARMDADDLCEPGRLEAQVELLDRRPDVAVAGCLIRCFPEDELARGMRRYEAWLNSLIEPADHARDAFVESPLCHPSAVMRRADFEAVGGYADDGFPEDYSLWLRLRREGRGLRKVPLVLFHWRDRPERLTRTDPRCAPERIAALKLAFLLDGPLRGRSSVSIWGAGPTGRAWRRRLEGRGVATEVFVDIDPRRIGRVSKGVPIVPPSGLERGVPGGHLLVAVGSHGARELIRQALAALGLREPGAFTVVA